MHRPLSAAVLSMALLAGACGSGSGRGGHSLHEPPVTQAGGVGQAGGASLDRVVDMDMVDVAFEPAQVAVSVGSRVKFVFHNRGKVQHEAALGDEAFQTEHETQMRQMSGMHHGGDAITVEPGRTGELVRSFASAGRLLIGCHEPGHYAAGMKVVLTAT